MNNIIINDIYFIDEVIYHDKMEDRFLEKYGIVVSKSTSVNMVVEDGFVIMSKRFAKKVKGTILKNLYGRKMLETFAIFMYENCVNMNSKDLKEFDFEIFRILIGNGIISNYTPASMIKAFKALKVNGFRALLGAVVYGNSKKIRAWRCLTCKRLRANTKGECTCKGYEYPVPAGIPSEMVPILYPDVHSKNGVMFTSVLNDIPKSCGVGKPRVETRLTKSVVYELDDQIHIIRKIMDIDIDIK